MRKRKKVEEEERRNHRGKIECPHLLCRATILNNWLFIAALRRRCGHYIFVLWFLLSFFRSSFFPRVISAVADCMSTILPQTMWPYCEFKMHVWNTLHAARWNTGRKNHQKLAIWAPSHNFVGLYLRNEGMYRQSEKICWTSMPPPHVVTIWWTSAH